MSSNRGWRALIQFHPVPMLLVSRLVIDVTMPYYLIFTPLLVICPTCNHTCNTSSNPTTVYAKANGLLPKIGGLRLA